MMGVAWLKWAWALITTKYGRIATLVIVAVGGLFGAKWRWQANAVKEDRQEQEIEAHDRINDAHIGIGASDDERRKRLHGMADDWKGR